MSFWTSHFPCLTFSFLSYKMEGLTENLDSKWSLKSLFSHCSSSFLIISCVKSRTFRAGALSPQSEQLHNQLLSWRGKPRSSERGTKFPMLPIANPCLGSWRQVIENQAVPLRACTQALPPTSTQLLKTCICVSFVPSIRTTNIQPICPERSWKNIWGMNGFVNLYFPHWTPPQSPPCPPSFPPNPTF